MIHRQLNCTQNVVIISFVPRLLLVYTFCNIFVIFVLSKRNAGWLY